MHFIVFDLEFNQDFSTICDVIRKRSQYPFEIIQIGAIKLDSDLKTVDTFNRYIKPTIYAKISSFITELTGITTQQLLEEEPFPTVYKDYIDFISGLDSTFCIWGISDIKELFRNVYYHNLDPKLLSKSYINLQPQMSKFLGLSSIKLIGLQSAVEALNIPITYKFHNAVYDAYYTSEILKKIYNPSIQPKNYDPYYIQIKPRKIKQEIDYDNLIHQFKKMYHRDMSIEEQEIIKLAYKMGKTHQFLK